jgi:molybdopterin/thiamine biosynthesis adenylyltransferase
MWDFGTVPIPEDGLNFGEIDLISAGAICQAALYVLMRLRGVKMTGRIFDDDLTGATNLNRNMLTVVTDIGSKKVFVIAKHFSPNLRLQTISDRFVRELSKGGKLAPRVLVGVDDIPSRWEVQKSAQAWLAVGGTSHFNVSSSVHNLGEPCSGCLHPVDDPAGANPIPTISFVSFWAGLAMAVRLIRETVANPYSTNRQHLWLTPLRMDLPHAAMWSPVAVRRDCAVPCSASRSL